MIAPAPLSAARRIDRAFDLIEEVAGVPVSSRLNPGRYEADLALQFAGVGPASGGDESWSDVAKAMGLGDAAGLAEIGEALKKAAVTTGSAASAILTAEQANKFIVTLQERDTLSSRIRMEPRSGAASGSIEKIGVAVGKIRASVENADDGYRAEPDFGNVPYQAVGVRLPFEITLQFLRYNIEGATVEDKIWNLMMRAFGIDLGRLDLLGDTTSGDPSLSINDGWLKQIAASGTAHRINGSTASLGVVWPNKAHLFAALAALPDKYKFDAQGEAPVWIGSPTNREHYQEYLSNRATGAGDAALGSGGSADLRPLGYEFLAVPFMPSTRMLLVPPKNLVRVITDQIERYRVGPETDWELATRRKRGYVFFIDEDPIVEEMDAVVDIYNLGT